MIRCRFFGLLALLLISLLGVSQSVVGQGYVTSTVTTAVTNSQPSTLTVEPSISTSTAPQSHSIFSGVITILPAQGACGRYFVQPFNATAGENLSGALTAEGRVDFYVMMNDDYQVWRQRMGAAGGTCPSAAPVLSQHGTTLLNFTTRITDNGTYQIVVNNLSNSTVTANLTADLVTPTPVMVAITMYSTLTQANVQSLTLITLSTTPEESPFGSSALTAVALLVVIILGVIVALVNRKKRDKTEVG